jgi:hypothetical protein
MRNYRFSATFFIVASFLFLGLDVSSTETPSEYDCYLKCSICETMNRDVVFCPRSLSFRDGGHNSGCPRCFRTHIKDCLIKQKNVSCPCCDLDISVLLEKTIAFHMNSPDQNRQKKSEKRDEDEDVGDGFYDAKSDEISSNFLYDVSNGLSESSWFTVTAPTDDVLGLATKIQD